MSRTSAIKITLQAIDEAGAKRITLSDELIQAVPVVAAQLITGIEANPRTGGAAEPATLTTKALGVEYILRSSKYNLERFKEANKVEPAKIEQNINVSGNATFIIPAPVIGRLGEAPKTRE